MRSPYFGLLIDPKSDPSVSKVHQRDATVPVPCFLLFLCVKNVTQEIFSELDERKARRPDISRSFQKTEEEMEPSQRAATP
jgi:hypothetical protein